jgi:hypothetical protein
LVFFFLEEESGRERGVREIREMRRVEGGDRQDKE